MRNNKEEYRKIFAKISSKSDKNTIGITSTDKIYTGKIALNLAKVISETKKVLFIDLDNDNSNNTEFANYNELLRKESNFLKDLNLYRLNFTKSDDVSMIIESKEFLTIIDDAKKDFDYIIINEKSIDFSQVFVSKKFEDSKIFVVNDCVTKKNELNNSLEEIKKMGFEFFGVIYNKKA